MKAEENTGLEGIRSCVLRADARQLTSCIERIFADRDYNSEELSALHDDLLFAIAYSPNKEIFDGCKTALRLLPEVIREGKLQDSGISNTVVVSSFTFPLLQWLNERYRNKLFFHSFENEKADFGALLSSILPAAEAEICTFGYSKNKLFSKLCGGEISIEKIISLFASAEDPALRDLIFSQLGLYVELHLVDTISRTTALAPIHKAYYHSEILKKIDPQEVIKKRLPPRRSLKHNQKEELVSNARMMLAALGRETDPVTYCDSDNTEYYLLDRGFSIALFQLDSKHRLAFDSYIGFMMFKNGLPIAYGGAWMFLHRALIGINIFEAYRGGESSFLFAQLLRVYHQRYKIHQFSVEPYQYGKDNPDGISSGAYWFYYRFGFRSDDEKLAAIAEEEQKKMKANKEYKSAADVLKQFTKSNITLRLKDGKHGIDTASLSLRITATIATLYKGDRVKAIKAGHAIMRNFLRSEISPPKTSQLKRVFENWCLAFLVLNPQGKANRSDKFTFVKTLRAKVRDSEFDYLQNLQKMRHWLI